MASHAAIAFSLWEENKMKSYERFISSVMLKIFISILQSILENVGVKFEHRSPGAVQGFGARVEDIVYISENLLNEAKTVPSKFALVSTRNYVGRK